MREARPDSRTGTRLAITLATLLGVLVTLERPSSHAQGASTMLVQQRLDVVGPSGAREHVLVTYPRLPDRARHPAGHRWPVVVALHGLGEARRGPRRGYLGWNVDYALPRAFEALLRGRLSSGDHGGFVRPAHLEQLNAWLAARGFEGVSVVTPYTPAIAVPEMSAARRRYGDWLSGPMLSAVRRAHPGLSRTAEGTGIDGVSLGGRIALEVGFQHPEAFGAVGGIQPAVRGDASALAAIVRREAGQRIRLLTSDDDGFLEPTRELSRELQARQIPHELLIVPGPHAYAFNRGPGSIELLHFAQTALHPEPPTN